VKLSFDKKLEILVVLTIDLHLCIEKAHMSQQLSACKVVAIGRV
jgi:hypothetical protein